MGICRLPCNSERFFLLINGFCMFPPSLCDAVPALHAHQLLSGDQAFLLSLQKVNQVLQHPCLVGQGGGCTVCSMGMFACESAHVFPCASVYVCVHNHR